jgi:hypothetical protein
MYEGLTGPDNAKIPTEADINPGDLTKEEIELAKHPAFIMPKVRRSDPRPAFNLPIVPGEKPTPIITPKITKEEAKAPVDLSQIVSDPDLEDNLAAIPLPDIQGSKSGEAGGTKLNPVQDALFELMQSQKRRAAKLEKQETLGNYMAALQGFLGMMGGTSPYLFTNVGQGASSGISSLLQSQKLQGANERALGRDEYSTVQMQRLLRKDEEDRLQRKDLTIAGLDEKWARDQARVEGERQKLIDKNIENNPDLKFRLPLAIKKMSDAAALGKPADAATVTEYNRLMKMKQNEINRAMTAMPDLTRPGVGSGAGWSATQIKPAG